MIDAPPPLVRPVQGAVSTSFAYVRATPFAAGQRRVLRIAPDHPQAVRAACAGRMRFAGRAPGTIGVTLRCGAWAVTLSGLEAVRVTRGQSVRSGAIVGQAGTAPVALGVRRASDPFGYVDPEPLLRDPPPAGRPVPVVRAPKPRIPTVAPAPTPQTPALAPRSHVPTRAPTPSTVPADPRSPERRHPARIPEPASLHRPVSPPAAAARPTVPLLAWIGLVLAALGLPAGVHGRRRARARTVRARPRSILGAERSGARR